MVTIDVKKLEKFRELVILAKNGLTKEEFLKNFTVIIDLVKKLQATNKETLGNIDTRYTQIVETTLEQTKQATLEYCQSELARIAGMVEQRLALVKDGLDGQDADEQEVALQATTAAVEAVKPLIPTLDEFVLELPRFGAPVRDALELLPTGEKLKIDAIEDLQKQLDELKRVHEVAGQRSVAQAMGAQGGGRICKVFDLSGQLDGVTTVFNLPSMWRIIAIMSSSFPNAFRPTVEYVYDAGAHTLTFTNQITPGTTLASGQTLTIIYSE